jgi:hypothetical protein
VLVATAIYAWVGDVRRFPTAKKLAAYAGLVPTVRQSGGAVHVGGIPKQGAPVWRAGLVQASYVLLARCRRGGGSAAGDRAPHPWLARAAEDCGVALARHLLRIAYYILRDGTAYDAVPLRYDRRRVSAAAPTDHDRLASTAAATAARDGQGPDRIGTWLPAGSPRIDWSVPSPAWQPVPAHSGVEEHVWKDGDSWCCGVGDQAIGDDIKLSSSAGSSSPPTAAS